MAYNPTNWNPGAAPGISAGNLNKIETGIFEAHRDSVMSKPLPTDDIDQLKENGIYECDSTMKNLPYALPYKITVEFSDDQTGVQRLTSNSGHQWLRSMAYGSWRDWVRQHNSLSIMSGTGNPPSGGFDGDIYIKY